MLIILLRDCKSILEHVEVIDELLIFKCLKCNKKKEYFTKDLVKGFAKTYKLCQGDLK